MRFLDRFELALMGLNGTYLHFLLIWMHRTSNLYKIYYISSIISSYMNSLIKFGGLLENYIWELQEIKRKTQSRDCIEINVSTFSYQNCNWSGVRLPDGHFIRYPIESIEMTPIGNTHPSLDGLISWLSLSPKYLKTHPS